MLRNKRAQSVLEYVVVLVAILAAIVFFVTTNFAPNPSGQTGLSRLFNRSGQRITNSTGSLARIVNGT